FRVDYTLDLPTVKVRPDIVFTRRRLAVFIDGCFWHRCPIHGNVPKHNSHYWAPKLRRNAERDNRVTQALEKEGWTVVRAWEHEQPDDIDNRILEAMPVESATED